MIVAGLIKFLIGFIGLTTTIIYLISFAFKRNSRSLKKAGIVFGSTVTVIIVITLMELSLYPVNQKKDQLVLTAFREAPIGAYWLGLYIKGDTILLKATSEKGFYNGDTLNYFLIKGQDLVEMENTEIRGLKITMNKLN
uniref:Uncharacterized protein n=1 Tax=Roseihalotalea indica TaxID=2867963 RepID=A0AA49JFA7_9BACT|nr:hypothetical protein K4G66_06195 [Tunicatimonas sp. TK19036]